MKNLYHKILTVLVFTMGCIYSGVLFGQHLSDDRDLLRVDILQSDLQGITLELFFPAPDFIKSQLQEPGC